MKDPIEINSELKSGSQQNEKIKNWTYHFNDFSGSNESDNFIHGIMKIW